MGGMSTIYDVKVQYTVDNRAGHAVGDLVADTKKLSTETKHAKSEVMAMGAALVAAFAGHEVKSALIDFNSGVENAKIGLSAMVQGNLGGTWDNAIDKANKLYDEFQAFSQMTPVTTQEMLVFGKSVAVSTFQAGGAIKDLVDITEQGVVAAKAFGYETAYASLELSEMLAGNVNKRMMFAKQLLGMAKVDEAKFNAMTADQRRSTVEQVLKSDAMKNAAKAFSESWSGVTSTFEDKLQITLGKVGLPLFAAIKDEIKGWSDWLDQNKHRVEEIAKTVGEGLATGFHVVKDAVKFLVDHADLMLSLGKIWLAVQVGGLARSGAAGVGAIAGGAGGLFGKEGFFTKRAATDSIDPFTGEYSYKNSFTGRGRQDVSWGNIGSNITLVAQAAAVGVAIGSVINDLTGLDHKLADMALDQTSREFERVTKASDALAQALQRAADAAPKKAAAQTNLEGSSANYKQMANLAADAARMGHDESTEAGDTFWRANQDKLDALANMGVDTSKLGSQADLQKFADQMNAKAQELADRAVALQSTGNDAWEFGFNSLTEYQKQTLDAAKAQQDLLAYINSHGMRIDPKTIIDIMRGDTDDPDNKHKRIAEKPNVTVHINRIEVQSDDPDRIAFGLIESFRDAAKNPSAALRAIREG